MKCEVTKVIHCTFSHCSLFNTPTPGITIQSQELYKLAQYLQEALHREKMLEQKLSTLQELVHNTQESSEGGWQVSTLNLSYPQYWISLNSSVSFFFSFYSVLFKAKQYINVIGTKHRIS